MKKLTIILALAVAAIATAGQFRNASNPQTNQGKTLPTTEHIWPFPECPPDCGVAHK